MRSIQEELRAWRIATVLMVTLSVLVFVIQRFVVHFFDVLFEIFLFHLPAVTIVALLLYFGSKSKT